MTTKPVVVRPPKAFDLAKFETMVEPFTVRVEKIKGSTKYEIPLPVPDGGGVPGTGWSKDQTRELQTWLVTEWSGGGHYQIAITDASSPSQLMEWTAYYPLHEFPEKVPPTLQGAFFPNVPTPLPTQAKPIMAQFPGSGGSLPLASHYPQAMQPQPMVMPAPQGYYQPPVPYGYATPMQAGGGGSSEAAMLRDQLARAREEAQARDFERRLAEMKAESERQMQALQQSMASMIQQLTQSLQAQQRPAVDPAIEQMREANRRLEEQLRAQQVEVERTRREAELRDEIRRTQETTQKLVEESNRRFEAVMASAATKGPDPQVMMFQQMFASQMDAMKEMARNSQAQLDRVQNHIMRPQDILAIAKESQSSTEHVVGNISRQYEQMFAMSRALTEQAAQLNQGQGGNEVIGLVRDVGANLAEMARKYTGDKSKEAVAQVNAHAEVAKAQAEVQKAQLEQMARMAQMEAAIKSGAAVQMPDGSFRAGGAHQHVMPAVAGPSGPTRVGQTSSARPWIPPKAQVVSTPANGSNGLNGTSGLNGAPQGGQVVPIKQPEGEPRRIKGRTDVEWFGLTLPNVMELREAVDKFITALGESPPRRDGAEPAEAAFAIQQAASEVMRRQIPIPAMIDLLMQGMVADFLDVLLPDAPQAYRDDVVKILMNGDAEEEDEDDDDDDDDSGESNGVEQPHAS